MSNASLVGFNKIVAASGENRVGSAAKAPGTANTAFHSISLPNVFRGDSNNQITNDIITGSDPVGTSIQYAISGTTAIGAADHKRPFAEVGLSDQIPSDGELHRKTGDHERIVGGIAAGGAWKQKIDGTWVNSSGVAGTPVGSGFSHKQIISGSGDLAAQYGRGNRTQQYNYRFGLSDVEKSLPVRNQ
jgi:hypothetical protein